MSYDDDFDRPLERLRSHGVTLPAHLTRSRIFGLMVEHGLLSPSVVDAYLQAYQIAEYSPGGQGDVEQALAEEALLKALAGVDFEAGKTLEFKASLRSFETAKPQPVRISPVDEPVSDEEESWPIAHEDEYELEELDGNDVEFETRPILRFRSIKSIAIFILWSVVMLGLGHWGPDYGKRIFRRVDYHFFGGVRYVGTERQLQLVRQRAAAHPDNTSYWREYEAFSRRTGRWEDLVIALRHQVQRDSNNAELLNNLAWLLCTADAHHVRDPVEALALAERAYQLNQAPRITDTLAEAAFQTGDVKRAIALEEDALKRIGGEDEFYRGQLKKFKAGLQ